MHESKLKQINSGDQPGILEILLSLRFNEKMKPEGQYLVYFCFPLANIPKPLRLLQFVPLVF